MLSNKYYDKLLQSPYDEYWSTCFNKEFYAFLMYQDFYPLLLS